MNALSAILQNDIKFLPEAQLGAFSKHTQCLIGVILLNPFFNFSNFFPKADLHPVQVALKHIDFIFR